MQLSDKYPHIRFTCHWQLSDDILLLLGECDGLIQAISRMPVLPEYYEELYQLALLKGAQSTTAIEGNTLTFEEIKKVSKGEKLPPSKDYQQREVQNIIEAMRELFEEVIENNKGQLITPELIKRFHQMVGKNLGETFESLPGKFRERNVTVGKYRAPDYGDVGELINQLCEWMRKEFHYEHGQSFHDYVLQAMVCHVYFELIHPFSDGNGRTGRLLEFYILLRGGNPDIASDILPNHYNMTRPEYYHHLNNVSEKRDITGFIRYALLGYRDGLIEKLNLIRGNAITVTWMHHIHDTIDRAPITSETTRKRRRHLMLDIPTDKWLTENDLLLSTPRVAREYAKVNLRTLQRDLEDLLNLKLLEKNEHEKKYRANLSEILQFMARKKGDVQNDISNE